MKNKLLIVGTLLATVSLPAAAQAHGGIIGGAAAGWNQGASIAWIPGGVVGAAVGGVVGGVTGLIGLPVYHHHYGDKPRRKKRR